MKVVDRNMGRIALKTRKELPKSLVAVGFHHKSEFAWKKSSLEMVYKYCANNNIAIGGFEAWVVISFDDLERKESAKLLELLDSESKPSLLAQGRNYYVYGVFPMKDGRYAFLNWDAKDYSKQQSWIEYAKETIKETREAINLNKFDDEIVDELKPYLFYQIMFQFEDDTLF